MKLKKVTAILLTAIMTVSLAACGSSSDGSSDSTGTAEMTQALAVPIRSESASRWSMRLWTRPRKGFRMPAGSCLARTNVEFDVQNAQGEQTMCSTIVNNFVSSDVDLILANATLPLQTAAQATSDIPILGTSVTDYGSALGIDDWTGATGVNISGTSDLAPIEEQEDMLLELVPEAQTVGILYCSAESNSKYQAELFEAELEADGISYKEYTAADSNEIQSVTQNAVEECDAIYIPTDNTMASNTQIINNICLPAKVPVIAGEEGICSGCGVATLSISYYDLGYQTGEMAYKILAEGEDIASMEVETAAQVTKKYNPAICEELGITIPEGYEAIEAE